MDFEYEGKFTEEMLESYKKRFAEEREKFLKHMLDVESRIEELVFRRDEVELKKQMHMQIISSKQIELRDIPDPDKPPVLLSLLPDFRRMEELRAVAAMIDREHDRHKEYLEGVEYRSTHSGKPKPIEKLEETLKHF